MGMPKWPPSKTILTYTFISLDLHNDKLSGAVQQAFDTQAAVTKFTFEEVNGVSDTKIRLYWHKHGDGAPFDGWQGYLLMPSR